MDILLPQVGMYVVGLYLLSQCV